MRRKILAEAITLGGAGVRRVFASTVLVRDALLVCGAASFDAVFLAEFDGAVTRVGLAGEEGAARSLAISRIVCSSCSSPPIGPVKMLVAGVSVIAGRAGAGR